MRASTMARRETTRHAGDENVHRRGGAREAGRARGMKTRAFGDTARDRRAMSTARQAATLESAFGDITNQYVRSRGDGRAATESKARLVGRRAAALLVDPAGLSEEISEVEEWAAALNDRGVRDARIDLERADQDTPPVGGFEDEDEDEDEDDASSEGQRCFSESESAAAAARDAEKRDAEKARIAKAEKQAARAGVLGVSNRAEDGAIGATGMATIEATEYAKARPKRETAGKTSVAVAGFRDADGGTLELRPLRAFAANTRPGSGEPGAQPFRVVVRPAAQLVMDTHAHLCTNEVIGYLGGAWDAAARVVTVDKAFPGRGLASGSDVEMDPVAEVELKARVESEGMRVVGWYHSHPVFEPTPSGVDVDNQLNYQSLFAAALDSEETEASSNQKRKTVSPFVGFIVGPYDLRLPTRVSKMTCFVAERRASGRGGAVEDAPFEVRYETTSDAPDAACVSAMCDVVTENARVAGRVRINELWRHFTNIANNKPDGGPCTKLAKLRASLAARLPDTVDELQEEKMLDAVAKHIQSAWNVDLGF